MRLDRATTNMLIRIVTKPRGLLELCQLKADPQEKNNLAITNTADRRQVMVNDPLITP